MNQGSPRVRRLTWLALMTAMALAIYVLESAIPPLVPIPGVKLGLANIITLTVLVLDGPRDALGVLIARILLGSIFAGQMISFLYSLAGGLFCLLVMWLIRKWLTDKNLWFVSILGALSHNAAQLAVAALILQSGYVFYYAPFLVLSGLITGLFTGVCARWMVHYLKKHLRK